MPFAGTDYHVAAFVQSNFGRREQRTIAGVPVGRALVDWQPEERAGSEAGSIIAILATDAPLLAHQLKRLARRVGLGIGRAGATSGNGSGDIFLAFSTANADALHSEEQLARANFIPDAQLNPFFDATIQAVDEPFGQSLSPTKPCGGATIVIRTCRTTKYAGCCATREPMTTTGRVFQLAPMSRLFGD